jgi:hypothetical protein
MAAPFELLDESRSKPARHDRGNNLVPLAEQLSVAVDREDASDDYSQNEQAE